MLKTNKNKLFKIAVQGDISQPYAPSPGGIGSDGKFFCLPSVGGITYNYKIGDLACGYEGDHVEPGVSIKCKEEKDNSGLNILSCIGNEAEVVSGDAKGDLGFVTGKHGGIEHVIIYFNESTLEKLNIEDKIKIKSLGLGLKLLDFPEIQVKNIDPGLFEKLNIEVKDNKLIVPVAKIIPGKLMGSGIGSSTTNRGDYDITLFDEDTVKEYNLDKLRMGDIVLLQDCDNTYGRNYIKDAVSIGIVVHSNCLFLGHGPGVTTVMTCKRPLIEGKIDEKANIADIMGI